jgi:hypothetical protein
MASTLSLTNNAGPRIRASLLSLSAITAFALAFGVSTYLVGTQWNQFMRPDRPAGLTEATAVIPINYAFTSHEKNDVIILGDSCPQSGIDPVYFEELTGLRAYNLASIGFLGIDGIFVTAQAYLSNHPAPRVIVLSLGPVTLSNDFVHREFSEQFVRVYGRKTGFASSDEGYLEPIKRGADIVRSFASACACARRYDYRDDKLYGKPGDTFATLERRLLKQRGYDRLPDPRPRMAPRDLENFRTGVAVEWDRGVRALNRLAESKGARLLIRLAPIRADAAILNFEDVRIWLQGIAKSEPDMIVRPDIIYYDPALCWDARHVNATGAKKFTTLVAGDVLAALGRKRPAEQNTSSRK